MYREYPSGKTVTAGRRSRQCEVWVKLEGNNPSGSVKDRAALAMIQQAELRYAIKPGDVLII